MKARKIKDLHYIYSWYFKNALKIALAHAQKLMQFWGNFQISSEV